MFETFMETNQKVADRMYYSSILPPMQGLMIMTGVKYQTGSDYSMSFLKRKVGELMGLIQCETCNKFYSKDEMSNFNDGSPVCAYCLDNADIPDNKPEEN